ncbi:hypothetical protein GA0115240_17093 [Streptomyces sp. DvalAA-14]|uniref:hypothetical protein n=1 Tax=unclassified Streptomyces TaxID=2593676 RepID=UPI00081AFBE9|nr:MULTISPECIES: hypothetical protein [unclassified Streptomyces]MYS24877.1 hypothetical protein [Streptomyces sp. SID4948]SCE50219.1 hypothetical protein GA0115240_17093 [Streptomyces sp. DvalAA-14]
MSETTDPSIPPPEPRWNQPGGPEWGPTAQPTQQPAAADPPGARTGMLLLLGVLVIVAVVLLVYALMGS